ncbi:MAG TPA: hypothetical protein VLB76_16570 [Thermoanaerobaculia bacterium]|nr:hypothetical protein [Thermoanaerobaculia bacterium]
MPAIVRVDLNNEKEGGEPSKLLSVVGDWSIATDDGKKVLLVDGRQWKKGQPAGGLADRRAPSTARATRSSSTTSRRSPTFPTLWEVGRAQVMAQSCALATELARL